VDKTAEHVLLSDLEPSHAEVGYKILLEEGWAVPDSALKIG
jgi:hypothetical protein